MGLLLVKRLFEVQILHDFYLIQSDRTSFFSIDPNDQPAFLKNQVGNDRYPLGNDLTIEPTAECRRLMRANQLFFAQVPLGFIVGMKVDRVIDPVTLVESFAPARPIGENIKLHFTISVKNNYFRTFTNGRFRTETPASYFFTNEDPDGVKAPPALSLPPSTYQPNRFYEMGELAVVGGQQQEALERTDQEDAVFWRPVTTPGLVSERDRHLLPKNFRYAFDSQHNVTEASFTLFDLEGEPIKQITRAQAQPFQAVQLNFQTREPVPGTEPEEISSGFYDLEVTASGGYQDRRRLYLDDELYRRGAHWGVIEIATRPVRPEYQLFDNLTGNLLTTRDQNGAYLTPHRIYELRLRTRHTFWRYRSIEGKELKKDTKNVGILDEDNGRLVTTEPLPLSFSPFSFKAGTPPDQEDVFLPMPELNSLREEGGRYYSDIRISKVKDIVKLE